MNTFISQEDFVKLVLEGTSTVRGTPVSQDIAAGLVGFDDDEPVDSTQGRPDLALRLLTALFGDGRQETTKFFFAALPEAERDKRAALYEEAGYVWSATPDRPFHVVHLRLKVTGDELTRRAKSSTEIALDLVEDELAKELADGLSALTRGQSGNTVGLAKIDKGNVLLVVSVVEARGEARGELIAFGAEVTATDSMETFVLQELVRDWLPENALGHLRSFYQQHIRPFEVPGQWHEAFVRGEARKKADAMLSAFMAADRSIESMNTKVNDLLRELAVAHGMKREDLFTQSLPSGHFIGADPANPSLDNSNVPPGVILRDRDRNGRVLGYVLYVLGSDTDVADFKKQLATHNAFDNVALIYPSNGEAQIELWHGTTKLAGRLKRNGTKMEGLGKVLSLLGRFFRVSQVVVRSPKDLAIRLAKRAKYLRTLAQRELDSADGGGHLRKLYNDFRAGLIADLKESDFANYFAQTVTNGLLTARWASRNVRHDTGPFTVTEALAAIPVTNPFLAAFFKEIDVIRKVTGSGALYLSLIEDTASLLERVDVSDVFSMGTEGDEEGRDPVIHFFEDFLAAYDKKERVKRGVYYTPRPVVSYIVRSVDELLRTELGLADGLADITSWAEMAARNPGLQIPDGVKPSQDFVQILDPATGTGTFLVEAIQVIHRTMVAKWRAAPYSDTEIDALWNDYVPEHLLTRLHGYELLMAPYAIAHLKIGLVLHETGYRFGSLERARVYLTNALEPANDFDGVLAFAIPAVARESVEVARVKRFRRFTTVLGNPPYSNYSANLSAVLRAIVDKYRRFRGARIRERNQLQFERNLQDDYVKFIAIGEEALRSSNVGILGYITNATMLASSSLRGMREHLRASFTEMSELHLHGGVNENAEVFHDDQNVFDIAQAVCIHLYVRQPHNTNLEASGTVRFAELCSPRPEKYSFLSTHSVLSTEWRLVVPDGENCAFADQDGTASHEPLRFDDVFVKFGAGIKTNQDSVAIGFNEKELLEAVQRANESLVQFNATQHVRPILYRPFDTRVVFYHEDIVASRSLPTMRHVLSGPNVGLIASSTWTSPERFSVNVSRHMIEMKTGTHDRGTTYFPLYRYENTLGGGAERVPNLQPEFRAHWEHLTGTRLVDAGNGDLTQTTGPEDVFHWIYGLCHSEVYRRHKRASLAQGFPIVLFPSTSDLLRELSARGKRLASIHLLEEPYNHAVGTFFGDRNAEVEKVTHVDGTVWIDKKQTSGFTGVTDEFWAVRVGGHQVCEKWLKDRKGRTLSIDDIAHYQKIVVAISGTIRLMKEIDEVIDQHGGWPDAFVTKEGTAP